MWMASLSDDSRFRQCMLPDEITLQRSGYVLRIPDKWKAYQN